MANKGKRQSPYIPDQMPRIEDDYLRELMSRARNGIGDGPSVGENPLEEASTTFRMLDRLNLLKEFGGNVEKARGTKELSARLSPTPKLSVPVWFFNEVMSWLIKDDEYFEILTHNMIQLNYLREAQVASCALWNLGFGKIGHDGVSKFARLAWTRRWVLYRE